MFFILVSFSFFFIPYVVARSCILGWNVRSRKSEKSSVSGHDLTAHFAITSLGCFFSYWQSRYLHCFLFFFYSHSINWWTSYLLCMRFGCSGNLIDNLTRFVLTISECCNFFRPVLVKRDGTPLAVYNLLAFTRFLFFFFYFFCFLNRFSHKAGRKISVNKTLCVCWEKQLLEYVGNSIA